LAGFRPDELTPDGTNLGPSLRLVYRLLCSNTDLQQVEVEVLCVAPRGDLIAYAVAAARLPVRRPGRIAPTPGSARSLQGLAATSLSDRGPAMNAAPSRTGRPRSRRRRRTHVPLDGIAGLDGVAPALGEHNDEGRQRRQLVPGDVVDLLDLDVVSPIARCRAPCAPPRSLAAVVRVAQLRPVARSAAILVEAGG
jgi:hypothetical protein